jgi:hypothetical protein
MAGQHCGDVGFHLCCIADAQGRQLNLERRPAVSMVRKYAAQDGLAGSKTTAIRLTLGKHSFMTCSHLPPMENSKLVKPVIFPSGCARFVT